MGERKPLSMTARKHHYYMGDAMRRLEWDLHNHLFEARRIPKEWCEIATRNDTSRTRVTMRVDDDVLKFFKSMGPGYQARMNLVLRTYMHGRLAKIVRGPDTTDWILHPERLPDLPEEVQWGDAGAELAELLARAKAAGGKAEG